MRSTCGPLEWAAVFFGPGGAGGEASTTADAAAKEASHDLEEVLEQGHGPGHLRLSRGDAVVEDVVLSEGAVEVLRFAVERMGEGNAVTVEALPAELTAITQEQGHYDTDR